MGNETPLLDLTGSEWTALFTIVISTGTVALFIYYYGLRYVLATHATIYELFWPLTAVLIDIFVRDRTLTAKQFLGGALLVGASIFLSRQRQTDQA